MPSNHVSNEPYHEALRESYKHENEPTIVDNSTDFDVVNEVIRLKQDRDELAAMLAYSLGTTRKLKKFLVDWNVAKLTKKGEGYPSSK